MSQKKVNNRLSDLTKKYQSFNVVSEIENNLSNLSSKRINLTDIKIYPLLDTSLYEISLYKTLRESITTEGILTPIIIYNDNSNKYLISGMKRYLIAKSKNMKDIPCFEINISTDKINQYILSDIIRNNDNVLIKTYCFKNLISKYNYTQESISSITSLSLSNVKNILRLDNLPSYIKKDITLNKISYGKARALLNLSPSDQKELYTEILNPKLSVRDIEILKRKYIGSRRQVVVTKNNKSIRITFLSEEDATKNLEKVKKLFSLK